MKKYTKIEDYPLLFRGRKEGELKCVNICAYAKFYYKFAKIVE